MDHFPRYRLEKAGIICSLGKTAEPALVKEMRQSAPIRREYRRLDGSLKHIPPDRALRISQVKRLRYI